MCRWRALSDELTGRTIWSANRGAAWVLPPCVLPGSCPTLASAATAEGMTAAVEPTLSTCLTPRLGVLPVLPVLVAPARRASRCALPEYGQGSLVLLMRRGSSRFQLLRAAADAARREVVGAGLGAGGRPTAGFSKRYLRRRLLRTDKWCSVHGQV